jgi:hypothetical protein
LGTPPPPVAQVFVTTTNTPTHWPNGAVPSLNAGTKRKFLKNPLLPPDPLWTQWPAVVMIRGRWTVPEQMKLPTPGCVKKSFPLIRLGWNKCPSESAFGMRRALVKGWLLLPNCWGPTSSVASASAAGTYRMLLRSGLAFPPGWPGPDTPAWLGAA